MANHAVLYASSSHLWMNCPPSVRLTERIPDNGSVYAAEGSEAHALCEYKLRQALGMEAENPLDSPRGLQYYDSAMEDAATGYVAFVLEQLEEIKGYVTLYKQIRETVQLGDMYVLNSAFDKNARSVAFQYVSKDKNKSVILVYGNNIGFMCCLPPIMPRGLDPDKRYRLKCVGTKERNWGPDAIKPTYGDGLMKMGISNPTGFTPFADPVYDAFAILLEAE